MSFRSLTDLAVKRDITPKGSTVASNDVKRAEERTKDALITAIPGEILTVYTALTGGALALIIEQEPSSYLPYRWGLLVVAVLLTPLIVADGYRRKNASIEPKKPTPRVPWAEMAAATIAAAAFFLAMPGSPLLAQLGANAGLLTSAAISSGGAILLTVFADVLKKGTQHIPTASPAPESAPSVPAGS